MTLAPTNGRAGERMAAVNAGIRQGGSDPTNRREGRSSGNTVHLAVMDDNLWLPSMDLARQGSAMSDPGLFRKICGLEANFSFQQ